MVKTIYIFSLEKVDVVDFPHVLFCLLDKGNLYFIQVIVKFQNLLSFEIYFNYFKTKKRLVRLIVLTYQIYY